MEHLVHRPQDGVNKAIHSVLVHFQISGRPPEALPPS